MAGFHEATFRPASVIFPGAAAGWKLGNTFLFLCSPFTRASQRRDGHVGQRRHRLGPRGPGQDGGAHRLLPHAQWGDRQVTEPPIEFTSALPAKARPADLRTGYLSAKGPRLGRQPPAVQSPQPRFIPYADYMPSPQPREGLSSGPAPPPQPSKKPRRPRNLLLGLGGLFVPLIAIGATGCGLNKTASTARSASAKPSTFAASPAAAQSGCATQVQNWFGNGGSSQLKTLAADIGTLGNAETTLGSDLQNGADASAHETAVQSDAATVQSDAQAVQGNSPPTCVPGLRSDVEAAAGDYSTSAIDASNSLNQLSGGNMSVAAGDIRAGSTAIGTGNAKIQAATSDVQAFDNGQS